jgi:beta-glucanase (GH16 family)
MDMYYSSDYAELQNYKPNKVKVAGGALQLTMAEEVTEAVLNSVNGTRLVKMNKTSGMVQSWNKFCFTGGYAEFAIKLPGNAVDSGFWAAAWLQGNLGRAGYLRSTSGRWPYSYDQCDGSGKLPWSAAPGQRMSRCNNDKGRGAPEIDVLEYGIFTPPGGSTPVPTYIHTMQMGPIAPPFTSWMLPDQAGQITGIHLPGADDPARGTYLSPPYGAMNKDGFPRAGSDLTDTYSASTKLGPEQFTSYHTYSVLWEPGEFIRWYLDDEMLFEVNKEALRAQTNSAGDSIGNRLIPTEAMYVILNLAMAGETWAKISPDLQLPAAMSVDYVRVYQRKAAVNVGCSPPDYPTQQEIACNAPEYLSPAEVSGWNLGVCGRVSSEHAG